MMRASLLVPTFLDGDAIGNDVLGMHAALSKAGVQVKVFANEWAERLNSIAHPLSDFPQWAATQDCLTIYHHAISWEQGWEVFRRGHGTKIVKYHNITPPHFFAPYSAHYETLTRLGHQMTASMVGSPEIDLFLADSQFSVNELLTLGLSETKGAALPPFHNLSAFDQVEASLPVLEQFLDGTINLVFVGRVAPNKGHRHLLHVVKAYRDLFGRRLRLLIVGDPDPPRLQSYQDAVQQTVSCLGLNGAVRFEGKVSIEALKAYYLVGHVLLVMSEHEGFCVPLLEAAHHRLPVLAYASTAVPEPLGPKGLLLDRLDYELFAAAIDTLYTEHAYAEWLADQQSRHLRSNFDGPVVEARFWELLAPFLH